MFRLTKRAVMDNVDLMIERVLEEAESHVSLTEKEKIEIRLVCEEILVNIVHYAYAESGEMTVGMEFDVVKHELRLCFMDHGRPFNPLEKETPDLDADASVRPVGGLGIYMVRQIADFVEYARNEGQNELTVVKSCKGIGG